MGIKELNRKVVEILEKDFPSAESELVFSNNFELLVAVMLSAQCTDKRVNMVTPKLFSLYPNAEMMSKAPLEDILECISSISYPNSKAKHLKEAAKLLFERYAGEVPSTEEELTALPGVGRKTANVVLSVAFAKERMPVDTHVFRVSSRIGLVKNAKTVLETEKQLIKNIPEGKLAKSHHLILLHGRYVCTARNPKCKVCSIKDLCLYHKNPPKK